ncbi:ABC transporter substrate-binding protein [Cohnella kolymensis]|uniref:ABC transporter substrate-binding protein n=1 Tax=Cohnella kolymensis TaxID=1590652 RepID=UPI00137933C1|nr:ABC transporter substrate-binding protein [Cohnella kolymensis]
MIYSDGRYDPYPSSPASDRKETSHPADDKLVMMFPSGSVPRDLPLVQKEINRYLSTKIGARIEIKLVERGVWAEKTGLMFASGEQIDLLFAAGWMRFAEEVAKGRFLPLDDWLNRYGKDIVQTLDPSILEAGKINGKVYGIETNKEFASSKGIVVRKDLADKYGIDLSSIRTLEDFGPVFQKIKENEPDVIPLQARADRSPLTFMMQYGLFDLLGDGPGVLERDGDGMKVVNMEETKAFHQYAQLMYEWNRAGYLNPDASTTKDTESEVVKAGKAFAYAESLKPGFDMQASRGTGMPMVTVELTRPYTTTADTTSAMFAITKNAKHPEKAMMFLNLLFKDKYLLNLLNWGIEGTHYVKKSDTVINYPPGVDARSVGYNLNQSWMFGNQLNSYLWANEDPHLWDEYRQFNENADKSKALGFVFNPDTVKAEIAACMLVSKEFAPALNTGEQDPSVILPMYIDRLKAAGADQIIQEKQRQLEEWLVSREHAAGDRR